MIGILIYICAMWLISGLAVYFIKDEWIKPKHKMYAVTRGILNRKRIIISKDCYKYMSPYDIFVLQQHEQYHYDKCHIEICILLSPVFIILPFVIKIMERQADKHANKNCYDMKIEDIKNRMWAYNNLINDKKNIYHE